MLNYGPKKDQIYLKRCQIYDQRLEENLNKAKVKITNNKNYKDVKKVKNRK